MKAKKRARIQRLVNATVAREVALAKSDPTYNVLSVRFADGLGIDIPYVPWRPRTEVNLPGVYIPEPES